MSKKLFIGNIEWGATEEGLKELFGQYGEVEEAIIIKDRMSGRSKGFGFVTFANDEDADKAMEALNGHDLNGRALVVNEARSKDE
jgi:RNA recognition motif-containing protein